MFKSLVDNFGNSQSEKDAFELVKFANESEITNEEIAYLALKLAHSGTTIKVKGMSVDIPSTGGPTSLSTLICPLILVETGVKVVKLGVPGRPAGGIDVLAQIPDYKINYKKAEIENILTEYSNKYIHFIADQNFTPLDKILFEYRKRNNKIGIPSLVVASLLSKKVACGLNQTGLDIRVSNFGNFGKTFSEAQTNALRFKEVGQILGISIKCFISDSNFAYQPYIGRGESLIALNKIFTDDLENDHLLMQHLNYCILMVSELVGYKISENYKSVLWNNFITNLKLQGSSEEQFRTLIVKLSQRDSFFIEALENGFVNYNLESIRQIITKVQNRFLSNELLFPDPFGIVLLKDQGSLVMKGERLVQVRYDSNLVKKHELFELLNDVVTSTYYLKSGKNFIIEDYGG
jgi:pyrimidine-nucleoside phosphorylase